MEVAVIADRVSFVGDTLHEIRPLLGVATQDEESRLDPSRGECVEDQRSGVGVRSVIKGERDRAVTRRHASNRSAEDPAVTMESTVRGAAEDDSGGAEPDDHTSTGT